MAVDFAIRGSLVRPGWPRYPVFVHRAAVLLHASFRPHLAMTPLRFANPSPPSGWVKDFHLQAADHARHTPLRGSPHFVRVGLDGLRSLPHLVAMIDTLLRGRLPPRAFPHANLDRGARGQGRTVNQQGCGLE